MYANGQGVPQDYAEAIKWFVLAAERGDANAQYNLGLYYANGRGVPQDDAEAVKWFRKAAEQGDASAQYNLGLFYASGRGVAQDDADGRQVVSQGRRARQRGGAIQPRRDVQHWTRGFARRCRRRFNGIARRRTREAPKRNSASASSTPTAAGVPQDDVEAVRWYRRAADRGDANAQTSLGFMYANGRGVPRDFAEAANWYRKAADRGDAAAQYNLGVAYDAGQGVSRDVVQAYKWYSVAGARFPVSAADNRAQAIKSRDLVAAKMTPAQIAEAQKLASEWAPR